MTRTRSALLATIACLAGSVPAPAAAEADVQVVAAADPAPGPRDVLPPPAAQVGDSADVLYERARQLMASGRHAEAASAFRTLVARFPDSRHAPDAPYWEAFNLYRTQETPALRQALEALERQAGRFQQAPSRRSGDAEALVTRVRGLLARSGDEEAARSVRQTAEEAARARSVLFEQLAATRGRDQAQEACPDLETRTAALNALVEIGPDEAIPVLRDVLAREDDCGRELAKRVPSLLGRLASPQATGLLLEIARSAADEELRRNAITYLARSGAPEAIDVLIEIASEGEDVEARRRALTALGQVGGARGYVVVGAARGVEEAERRFRVITSGEITAGRVQGVTVRGAGREGDAPPDPRIADLFRDLASDASTPVELRKTAIGMIGRTGGEGVVQLLAPIFRSTPELRETILNAVRRSDDPTAFGWLLTVAADRTVDEDVRRSAVYRAGLRDDGLADYLALYPELETAELKKSFFMGLSEREEPAAIDLLIRVARTEQDPEVRRSAIYWLGRSGDPRAAAVLREIVGG